MLRYNRLPQVTELSLDEFVAWPEAEFRAHLQRQWSEEASQFRLTWKWMNTAAEERNKPLFAVVDTPQWREIQCKMTLVLISEAIYNSTVARSGARWRFRWPEDKTQPRDLEHSQRLSRWSNAIWNYFNVFEFPACIPTIVKEDFINPQFVQCAAPSHHQMLEAQLQLHAWARANLAPEAAEHLIALDK